LEGEGRGRGRTRSRAYFEYGTYKKNHRPSRDRDKTGKGKMLIGKKSKRESIAHRGRGSAKRRSVKNHAGVTAYFRQGHQESKKHRGARR